MLSANRNPTFGKNPKREGQNHRSEPTLRHHTTYSTTPHVSDVERDPYIPPSRGQNTKYPYYFPPPQQITTSSTQSVVSYMSHHYPPHSYPPPQTHSPQKGERSRHYYSSPHSTSHQSPAKAMNYQRQPSNQLQSSPHLGPDSITENGIYHSPTKVAQNRTYRSPPKVMYDSPSKVVQYSVPYQEPQYAEKLPKPSQGRTQHIETTAFNYNTYHNHKQRSPDNQQRPQQSLPQHSIPEHQQGILQQQQNASQYQQSVPQQQQSSPQHQRNTTQYKGSVPQHQQSIPRHYQSSPQQQQSIPQRQDSILQPQQKIAQYQQSSPHQQQQNVHHHQKHQPNIQKQYQLKLQQQNQVNIRQYTSPIIAPRDELHPVVQQNKLIKHINSMKSKSDTANSNLVHSQRTGIKVDKAKVPDLNFKNVSFNNEIVENGKNIIETIKGTKISRSKRYIDLQNIPLEVVEEKKLHESWSENEDGDSDTGSFTLCSPKVLDGKLCISANGKFQVRNGLQKLAVYGSQIKPHLEHEGFYTVSSDRGRYIIHSSDIKQIQDKVQKEPQQPSPQTQHQQIEQSNQQLQQVYLSQQVSKSSTSTQNTAQNPHLVQSSPLNKPQHEPAIMIKDPQPVIMFQRGVAGAVRPEEVVKNYATTFVTSRGMTLAQAPSTIFTSPKTVPFSRPDQQPYIMYNQPPKYALPRNPTDLLYNFPGKDVDNQYPPQQFIASTPNRTNIPNLNIGQSGFSSISPGSPLIRNQMIQQINPDPNQYLNVVHSSNKHHQNTHKSPQHHIQQRSSPIRYLPPQQHQQMYIDQLQQSPAKHHYSYLPQRLYSPSYHDKMHNERPQVSQIPHEYAVKVSQDPVTPSKALIALQKDRTVAFDDLFNKDFTGTQEIQPSFAHALLPTPDGMADFWVEVPLSAVNAQPDGTFEITHEDRVYIVPKNNIIEIEDNLKTDTSLGNGSSAGGMVRASVESQTNGKFARVFIKNEWKEYKAEDLKESKRKPGTYVLKYEDRNVRINKRLIAFFEKDATCEIIPEEKSQSSSISSEKLEIEQYSVFLKGEFVQLTGKHVKPIKSKPGFYRVVHKSALNIVHMNLVLPIIYSVERKEDVVIAPTHFRVATDEGEFIIPAENVKPDNKLPNAFVVKVGAQYHRIKSCLLSPMWLNNDTICVAEGKVGENAIIRRFSVGEGGNTDGDIDADVLDTLSAVSARSKTGKDVATRGQKLAYYYRVQKDGRCFDLPEEEVKESTLSNGMYKIFIDGKWCCYPAYCITKLQRRPSEKDFESSRKFQRTTSWESTLRDRGQLAEMPKLGKPRWKIFPCNKDFVTKGGKLNEIRKSMSSCSNSEDISDTDSVKTEKSENKSIKASKSGIKSLVAASLI